MTAPENSGVVREFLKLPSQPRISRPALETLAIIAYRQPVTRPEIEGIRGVGAERVLASLLARGLIEEAGRRETPGRPIEYATTSEFLEAFGLTCLDDLPLADAVTPAEHAMFTELGLTGETLNTAAAGASVTAVRRPKTGEAINTDQGESCSRI